MDIRRDGSTPWSQIGDLVISAANLDRIGQAVVDAIVKEAKVEALKSENIPDNPAFYKSFKYRVSDSVVEVYCDWQWIQMVHDGKGPYRMAWQRKGHRAMPFRHKDGTVVFRPVPMKIGHSWVHPGIARHQFIERGLKKARREISRILRDDIHDHLAKGNPFL